LTLVTTLCGPVPVTVFVLHAICTTFEKQKRGHVIAVFSLPRIYILLFSLSQTSHLPQKEAGGRCTQKIEVIEISRNLKKNGKV
jgi:hypothetical protein